MGFFMHKADEQTSKTYTDIAKQAKRIQTFPNQTALAYEKSAQRVFVSLDPWDLSWSCIVSRIPINQTIRPYKKQKHTPYSFLLRPFDTI